MLNAKATCFLRRQSQAEDAENIRHAETGMRQRIAWIGGHGSFEPIQGDGQSVRQMKESPTPAQLVIIGRQVCRWPLAYLRDRGTVDLPWNRRLAAILGLKTYLGTYKHESDRDRWLNAIRKAGIPV